MEEVGPENENILLGSERQRDIPPEGTVQTEVSRWEAGWCAGNYNQLAHQTGAEGSR